MEIKYKKRAFTLVEVLVSVAILAILFTFLSNTISFTKKLNKPYIQKADEIYKQSKVFKILVKDFSQAIGVANITYGKRFDTVKIKTKNSIYNIIEPNVTYFVSKKDNTLIRTESLESYDLDLKNDIEKVFIYGDVLTENVKSFKVFFNTKFFNLLLRVNDNNPIVLKLERVE